MLVRIFAVRSIYKPNFLICFMEPLDFEQTDEEDSLDFSHYDNPVKARGIVREYTDDLADVAISLGGMSRLYASYARVIKTVSNIISGYNKCDNLDLALNRISLQIGDKSSPTLVEMLSKKECLLSRQWSEKRGGSRDDEQSDIAIRAYEENTIHNPLLV